MAFPSDLVRTKDWGNEVLTDADLEAQFDNIIDWIDDFADETGGHKHDATTNEGPKLVIANSTDTKLNGGSDTELTISGGAVTITKTFHSIDTESDAASDDLDTISGGTDGDIVILKAENTARTVVIKDGTGNIECAGDFSMDNIQDTITLIYDATNADWLEVCRSNNGA